MFWGGGVKPVDEEGEILADVRRKPVGSPEQLDEQTTQVVMKYEEGVKLKGFGNFKLDFLLYKLVGVDLAKLSKASLSTLELLPKVFSPFLIMILVSLFTQPNSKQALDRYYAKNEDPGRP